MEHLKDPWNLAYLVGFVTYMRIRHVFDSRSKDREKVSSRFDGLEKGLILVVFVGTLLVPALFLFTPWLNFADYTSHGALRAAGAGMMAAGLWLFWRSHADLGTNWSVTLELRKDHQLVKHGVYRRVRHPMYSAIWLIGIAQALLLPSWIAGPSALIAWAPLYFIRVPREEAMMREAFGEEYSRYMEETGRVIPRVM